MHPRSDPTKPINGVDSGVVDSDVDLSDAGQRGETRPREWDVLLAIAVGGVAGAEARYGLSIALPHPPGTWPWATLITNVLGSALIGVLMTVLASLSRPPRLVRPLLGVGVLGGFTTFSTFALDAHALLRADRVGVAVGYVAASLASCVLATAAAVLLTRGAVRR
jgi:fluoride exporter